MRTLWLSLAACLLAAGVAAADTVYLKNGRRIQGKIVKESDQEVVLRTPGGRVPVPRKLIKKIERTSPGRTALDMGRQRAREGDFERARQQFELALQDSDPAVVSQAREELAGLPAGGGGSSSGRPAVASGWPPQKDEPLSVAGFRDAFGRPVSTRALRGKVVLIELAGMQHPYSQAFAGGHERGGFGGVEPQPKVGNLQTQLGRFAGVSPDHEDLLVVQLLLTGPDGKTPPTVKEAGEWAEHFGHTRKRNVELWLGSAEHLEAAKDLFAVFVLVSPDGVVRFRSRNYPQLLPYIKTFVDAKASTPAQPQQPVAEGEPEDDYGHVAFTNIYPESLESPPREAPYPQALVPLPNPRSLADVPGKFRQFVNHGMAYVAQAALVKARAVAALKRGGDVTQAAADYKRDMGALVRAFNSLPRPSDTTMSSVRATLLSGVSTQKSLIDAAFTQVAAGKADYARVRNSKEAKAAMNELGASLQGMLQRFPRLTDTTKRSLNSHLGALASFPP